MRYPPFSKPLVKLLEKNLLPNNSVYLYIGQKSWEKGQLSAISRPTRTLVLPPRAQAIDYDWPVAKCDILLIETSPLSTGYIENIIQTLFVYAASKVILISVDFSSTFYEKDF